MLDQPGAHLLDLVIVMDYTRSMQQYIDELSKTIEKSVHSIMYDVSCYTRVALIKYRDHPEEENGFVTKLHEFTRDIDRFKAFLGEDEAQGGGDEPEAVADALQQLLSPELKWGQHRFKVAILVLDAPPHAAGCFMDAYAEACPCGYDPVVVCKELRSQRIKLNIFGCKTESLELFRDLYCGLAQLTGARYRPVKAVAHLQKLSFQGTRSSVNSLTIEQEVKEIADELTATHGSTINENVLAERVCSELREQGFDMKPLRRSKDGHFVVCCRGERIAENCGTLADMVEKLPPVGKDELTPERVLSYLKSIDYFKPIV